MMFHYKCHFNRHFQLSKIKKILAGVIFPHQNKHLVGFNGFLCTFKWENIQILWWQFPFEHRKSNKSFITRKLFLVESTNFLYLFGVVNMHRYAKNRPLRGHFRTKVNIEEFERKKVNGPILRSKPQTKESLNPMLGSLNYEVSPIWCN